MISFFHSSNVILDIHCHLFHFQHIGCECFFHLFRSMVFGPFRIFLLLPAVHAQEYVVSISRPSFKPSRIFVVCSTCGPAGRTRYSSTVVSFFFFCSGSYCIAVFVCLFLSVSLRVSIAFVCKFDLLCVKQIFSRVQLSGGPAKRPAPQRHINIEGEQVYFKCCRAIVSSRLFLPAGPVLGRISSSLERPSWHPPLASQGVCPHGTAPGWG